MTMAFNGEGKLQAYDESGVLHDAYPRTKIKLVDGLRGELDELRSLATSDASETTKGIVKLYTGTGNAVDGVMSQAATSSALTSLESQLTTINGTLSALQTVVGNLQSVVTTLQNTVTTMGAVNETDIDDLKTRVTSLQNTVTAMGTVNGTDIDDLKTRVSALESNKLGKTETAAAATTAYNIPTSSGLGNIYIS